LTLDEATEDESSSMFFLFFCGFLYPDE